MTHVAKIIIAMAYTVYISFVLWIVGCIAYEAWIDGNFAAFLLVFLVSFLLLCSVIVIGHAFSTK
jgi:hypothetical protein